MMYTVHTVVMLAKCCYVPKTCDCGLFHCDCGLFHCDCGLFHRVPLTHSGLFHWTVPLGPIGHLPHGVGSILYYCYRVYLTKR